MKIFSVAQIRNWDAYTIKNEPVSSIDLMERAAKACADWLVDNYPQSTSFKLFCGTGNNGGDGLAIARLLKNRNFQVEIYIVEVGRTSAGDFKTNLDRLQKNSAKIYVIDGLKSFPKLNPNEIIIDALFGSGLNKKPSGVFKDLINHLNKSVATIISVDVPSGMYIDKSSLGNAVMRSRYTLTFQQQKLGFLIAENESFFGEVIILDIGLSPKYYQTEKATLELVDESNIREIFIPRNAFANKGDYGYACLLAGSYGMMGAAVLSSSACLRSGVGKVTNYICKEGYAIMQTAVPEAMCKIYGTKYIRGVDNFQDFKAIGIGPGIGKHASHKNLLQTLFKAAQCPLVIDADALNVLSTNTALYKSIPKHTIITPHPKEFERLFGKSENEFNRINLALKKAKELNIFIVLKGHHSFIATPGSKGYFNSTGNAGMATAGSGDVLTGIITGLLAQQYAPLQACLLGVYLHGLAGDFAAENTSMEAMISGDIIEYLGEAFQEISKK